MTLRRPVEVFAAAGRDAWGAVQELRARPELRLVDSPRHASVLLVAGAIPPEHLTPLQRVHDQLPHPRAVVHWGPSASPAIDGQRVDGRAPELVAAIVDAQRALGRDPASTSPDRPADVEPNPWRGVGPHGQGGEGMMGGTPYGRPMAMTGPDRDGLELDRLHLRLGPFLPAIPPGVVLDVTLQGEVVQASTAEVAAVPHAPPSGAPFDDDATEPARRGLRWLAHALHLHGLDPLAVRAARLAAAAGDGVARDATVGELRALRSSIRRSALLWTLRGVGPVEGHGDAAARWRDRLDGIGRALHGDHTEAPQVSWDELTRSLIGMTLNEAVLTMASFDWQEPAEVPA
jgi:hypothetical protein